MKFLFFGDIHGRPGREAIKKILPELKKKYKPDLILANGENLSHGVGFDEETLAEMMEAGIDFFTSGNHVFKNKSAAQSILENKNWPIIRPANWSSQAPGRGYHIIELRSKRILVINLIGRVFMHKQHDDPFACLRSILDEYTLTRDGAKETMDAIVIDWHCEATSEKKALGWFADGQVSAVLGTHTHVPTEDARVLPQGTAYISDVGVVGPRDSVLGMDKDIIIKGFLTQMPQKFEIAPGPVEVNFVILDIEHKTGLAKKIDKKQEIVDNWEEI